VFDRIKNWLKGEQDTIQTRNPPRVIEPSFTLPTEPDVVAMNEANPFHDRSDRKDDQPFFDSVNATAQDVAAAYKMFLRRNPENMEVIEARVGLPSEKLLLAFMTSEECLQHEENRQVILEAAKMMALAMRDSNPDKPTLEEGK